MVIQQPSLLSRFKKAYSVVTVAVKSDRRIYVPFLIGAAIETAFLLFLYFSPREPLRAFMGPLITTFWGDQYLHYPQNFFLLQKLDGFMRMALMVFPGSLLSAVSIARLYKLPPGAVWKKYAHLFFLVLILTAAYYLLNRQYNVFMVKYFNADHQKLLFFYAKWWLGPIRIAVGIFAALILQSMFTYAMPILLTSEKRLFGAMAGSFMFFIRHIILTFLFIGLPMIFLVMVTLLDVNSGYLMTTLVPEAMFWILLLGIGVNTLILDPVITLTTAAFYAENGGKK